MKRFPIYQVLLFLPLFIFSFCKSDNKQAKETVAVRLESDPDRLNPMLSTVGFATDVYRYMFYSLVDVDPLTLELKPVLVKSLPSKRTIGDGAYKGLTAYDFEFLSEAKWDNGKEITGNDFVFTLKAVFNQAVSAERWRALLSFIKDVKVDEQNPKKFTVITTEDYFLSDPILGSVNIYPQSIYDPSGLMNSIQLAELLDPEKSAKLLEKEPKIKQFAEEFNNAKYSRDPEFVSGSGPYKLVEWQTGQQIVLQKKDNWWGDKLNDKYSMLKAYPKKLVFKIIADETSMISFLKDGGIDAAGSISPSHYNELKGDEQINKLYNIYTPTVLQYYYFAMNNKDVILSDKNVRKSIAHLMDLDGAIGLLDGLGERIIGPFHPSKDYYNHALKPVPFDMNAATNYLDISGWKDTDGDGVRDKLINGKKTKLTITLSFGANSDIGKKLSLMLQENGKKAGIEFVLDSREMSQIMGDVKAGKFQMTPLKNRLDPFPDDPFNAWHSSSALGGGGNRVAYSNKEADILMEEIRKEHDASVRKRKYEKLQEVIYEDQPVVFLFAPKEPILISKKYVDAKPSVLKPGFALNYFH